MTTCVSTDSGVNEMELRRAAHSFKEMWIPIKQKKKKKLDTFVIPTWQ